MGLVVSIFGIVLVSVALLPKWSAKVTVRLLFPPCIRVYLIPSTVLPFSVPGVSGKTPFTLIVFASTPILSSVILNVISLLCVQVFSSFIFVTLKVGALVSDSNVIVVLILKLVSIEPIAGGHQVISSH